jgi:hypothetical protein
VDRVLWLAGWLGLLIGVVICCAGAPSAGDVAILTGIGLLVLSQITRLIQAGIRKRAPRRDAAGGQ